LGFLIGSRTFGWRIKDIQFGQSSSHPEHTNFHNPDGDMNSQTFNQILEAQPPRLIQFALKFTF